MAPIKAFMLIIDGEPSVEDITTSPERAGHLLIEAARKAGEL